MLQPFHAKLLLSSVIKCLLIFCCSAFFLTDNSYASEKDVIEVKSWQKPSDLSQQWSFSPGDNLTWAKSDYDDSKWAKIKIFEPWAKQGYKNLTGYAWFRLKVKISVNEELKADSLALSVGTIRYGSFEVYVNGKLIGKNGVVGSFNNIGVSRSQLFNIPQSLVSNDSTLVLAIRCWEMENNPYTKNFGGGFDRGLFFLGDFQQLKNQIELHRYKKLFDQLDGVLLITIFLMAAFYHLQLYRRRSSQIEYLWVGLISIAIALNTFTNHTYFWASEVLNRLHFWQLTIMTASLVTVFALQGLWTMLQEPISRWLRLFQFSHLAFVFVSPILNLQQILYLSNTQSLWIIPIVPIFLYLLIKKLRENNPEAKTISLSLIVAILSQLSQFAWEMGLFPFRVLPSWGFLMVILAMAVSLSNRFAKVYEEVAALNRDLEGKVIERTKQLAESERRALEANQAKSVFLANMSHELRTPLNSILGFAQIIQRTIKPQNEIYKHISIISRSGEHLLNLINEVLSISKAEAGKVTLQEKSFNPHLLVQDLVSIFQPRVQAKKLILLSQISGDLPQQVKGDEGKIKQVLINLINNAIKFTNKGSICLEVEWKNNRASFTISDTGQGIAKDDLEYIFKPFAQTETGQEVKEGIGLGLYISQNIINLMGGNISVVSELGIGSKFSFEINLQEESETLLTNPLNLKKVVGLVPGQKTYKILTVDDNLENRMLLVDLLEPIGFSLREAINGQEAIEIWREWKPDLIFMDMSMKVIDGYSATTQIKKEANEENNAAKEVKIIALTASVFEQDKEKVYSVGCDDLINKPFYENIIFEKLSEHLGIKFIYQESSKEDIFIADQNNTSLTPIEIKNRLEKLPRQTLKKMYYLLLAGKITSILELLENIEKHDSVLSKELQQMVANYQIEQVLAIVEDLPIET